MSRTPSTGEDKESPVIRVSCGSQSPLFSSIVSQHSTVLSYPRGHICLRETGQYKEFLPSVDLKQKSKILVAVRDGEMFNFSLHVKSNYLSLNDLHSMLYFGLTPYRPLTCNSQMTRQRQQLSRDNILIQRDQRL